MPVAIVMPCLNEESTVAAAAASLSFGSGTRPAEDDVYLILVDNGSLDGTHRSMQRIARASRPGAVTIACEPERGYVPARRRGAEEAARLARRLGCTEASMLILQADADTAYLANYVTRMREAHDHDPGALLEGSVGRDPSFDTAHPGYRRLEVEVDEQTRAWEVDDDLEVVVDDKVCGYSLLSYLRWGGHRREWDDDGFEVHAETTRMLLSARARGLGRRTRVHDAGAITSRRKAAADPGGQFAKAGFPREEGWVETWRAAHPPVADIDGFAAGSRPRELEDAIRARRGHNLALFAVLPRIVAEVVGDAPPPPGIPGVAPGGLTLQDLSDQPAVALSRVLRAVPKPQGPS